MIEVFGSENNEEFGDKFLSKIVKFIRETYTPKDIFTKEDLEHWAETNGYIKYRIF